MTRLLLFAALVCFLLALIVAAGAAVFGTTALEWVAAGLFAYVASLLVPA